MRIGAVIVAAGSGSRMGGVAKALLRRGEQTFLERIITSARADDPVVVVGPPFGDEVAAHARQLGARVVVNPDPSRGMGSSVALGFQTIGNTEPRTVKSECPDHEHSESTVHGSRFPLHTREAIAIDAAWLWPVDHPDVERETLDKLLAAIGHHDVARPRCEGRGGHPPLIKRALFAKLATCTNAREVMFSADVIAVEVLDKGTIEDIDR